MPNISFDVFYNTDIINFTATRSGAAPRVKPDWKVRSAPKLAPKQVPTPANSFGRKDITNGEEKKKAPAKLNKPSSSRFEELPDDADSAAGEPAPQPKKKLPKLDKK